MLIALLGVTYTRYLSFLSKPSPFPILTDSSPESAPFPLLSTEIHLPASGANDHGVLAEGKRGRGGCGKDVSEGDGGGESGRHRIQNCLNRKPTKYIFMLLFKRNVRKYISHYRRTSHYCVNPALFRMEAGAAYATSREKTLFRWSCEPRPPFASLITAAIPSLLSSSSIPLFIPPARGRARAN